MFARILPRLLFDEDGGAAGASGLDVLAAPPGATVADEGDGKSGGDKDSGEKVPAWLAQAREDQRKDEWLRSHAKLPDLLDEAMKIRKSMPTLPKSEKDYLFATDEESEGVARDKELEQSFASASFAQKLSVDQAKGMANWLNEQISARQKSMSEKAKQDGEKAGLAIREELGEQGIARAERVLAKFGSEALAKEVKENPGRAPEMLRLAAAFARR